MAQVCHSGKNRHLTVSGFTKRSSSQEDHINIFADLVTNPCFGCDQLFNSWPSLLSILQHLWSLSARLKYHRVRDQKI